MGRSDRYTFPKTFVSRYLQQQRQNDSEKTPFTKLFDANSCCFYIASGSALSELNQVKLQTRRTTVVYHRLHRNFGPVSSGPDTSQNWTLASCRCALTFHPGIYQQSRKKQHYSPRVLSSAFGICNNTNRISQAPAPRDAHIWFISWITLSVLLG